MLCATKQPHLWEFPKTALAPPKIYKARLFLGRRWQCFTPVLVRLLLNALFNSVYRGLTSHILPQANTGRRKQLEAVTIKGSSYEETDLRSPKSAMVCLIF